MVEEIKDIVKILNPWWKDQKISEELAKPFKRYIFKKILDLLNYKQIVILTGLRRVGKTTLLYQIIETLLKNKEYRNILYFNFDKKVEDITKILDAYKEISDVNWKKEKIYIFLDEITRVEKWARQIKLIYDAFPNIKFFLSSSSSTGLEDEAIKALSGRYFLINIKPLSFSEYLVLSGNNKFLENNSLYENEIKKEVPNFSLRTFPEIVGWKDELLIRDYLRTTIIDKIVKSDLPEKFKNINLNLLSTLIEIFYREPGVYVDYDNISKNLKISKKTLFKHIFYLEFSYLLRKVWNFRPSIFATKRKMQRAYPYWWTLSYCYSENKDKIMEALVASVLDAKYYWREGGKEIDFLAVKNRKIIPIEVKNKSILSKENLKNMVYFLKKYKLKEGFVIYNGREEEIKLKNFKIKLIPLWKWLLQI